MKIRTQDFHLLAHDDHPDSSSWELVDVEQVGEWRWGDIKQVTLRHLESGELWGYTYQHQGGDHWHNSYNDEGDVLDLVPMEAVQVTSYRQKK